MALMNDFFVHLCAQTRCSCQVHPHLGDGPALQPCAAHFENHGLLADQMPTIQQCFLDRLCWQIEIRQTIGSNQLHDDSLTIHCADVLVDMKLAQTMSNTVQR